MVNSSDKVALSIVIVNWNSWEDVNKCLTSIIKYASDLKYEIIIVDNNSSDDSVFNIRHHYPEVNLIALKENPGFSKANNLAFSVAQGKYLLALNPDTEIKRDTLQRSIEFLEGHPDYGCVGVKTRKGSGEIQLNCAGRFPTFKGTIFYILYLDRVFPKLTSAYSVDMTDWDHEDSRDVDKVAGSYMMIPRSVYQQIGGFDERVILFLEDVEYCRRMWNKGFKIRYLAEVEIVHYGGKSTATADPSWIARLRFDGFYLYMKDNYGTTTANNFVKALVVILPIKAILLPFMCLGIYFIKRENKFKSYFFETITGICWSVEKLGEIIKLRKSISKASLK